MVKNKNLVWMLGFIGAIVVLFFALSWAFHSPAPKAIPAAGKTPTPTQIQQNSPIPPTPSIESYDFRGTKLYLAQPLPNSPANANVYLLKKDQPATLDEARALAQQFGIQSPVYRAPGQIPNTTDFIFTDGKQMLSVHSNFYFNYTSDTARNNNNFNGIQNPNADAIIAEFLKSHGFNFSFKIITDELRGGYIVQQLAPDGVPMQYEFYSVPVMQIMLDENGQVLSVTASLMDYDQTPVGTFGIISAEDAFQKMLDDTIPAGKIESGHSASRPITEWRRVYPTNETISVYGYASSIPALDTSTSAFVQIDGYTATGSLKGMDTLKPSTFVEATGQFIVENEIQEFKVESWKVSKELEDGLAGTLHRDGAKVILSTTDQGDCTLVPDVPADLPMPFQNAFVIGTKIGNTFDWKMIDDRMTAGGGGGGGGGLGFHQLNISGTPIPFPTATPNPTLSSECNYVIQAGDTINSIASANGITADELMKANGMSDPSQLTIGQTFIIPTASQGGGGGAEPVATGESNTPASATNTPPTLTIEKVELVYFVSNPLYQANDPGASRRSPYIQPAWHFSGHYSNGDAYDILIQALKQEFLSPEIAPYIQGG